MAAITVLRSSRITVFWAEQQRRSAAQAFKSRRWWPRSCRNSCDSELGELQSSRNVNFSWENGRKASLSLRRAIKFDPENQVVSERFFQELIVHRDKALPLLIASFAHQDVVYHAAFSPDGARILTASWDKVPSYGTRPRASLWPLFAHQGTVNAAAF